MSKKINTRLQLKIPFEIAQFITIECNNKLITKTEFVMNLIIKEYKRNKNGLFLDCESLRIL